MLTETDGVFMVHMLPNTVRTHIMNNDMHQVYDICDHVLKHTEHTQDAIDAYYRSVLQLHYTRWPREPRHA